MQKISHFFSLSWAKIVPMVMAAGRAGGTTIVIISKDLMTNSFLVTWKHIAVRTLYFNEVY